MCEEKQRIKIFNFRIGPSIETIRQLLISMMALQGAAGLGAIAVISSITNALSQNITTKEKILIHMPHILVPLLLHLLVVVFEGITVLNIESEKVKVLIYTSIGINFCAFSSFVWFLVKVIGW